MRTTEQKINNIIGQLEGIKNMLESNRSCTDVLTQLKASKAGLCAITAAFVEENILEQLSKDCAKDKDELHKLIKELSK